MLSRENYITMSISSNLFWLRIMKEHAIFIESSIPPIHSDLAKQADGFKQEYGRLLLQTIRMANGVLTKETLQSGQYFTQFTEVSEQAVQKFTGIQTESSLTQAEYQIEPYYSATAFSINEHEISGLNESILKQTTSFARFKSELLNNQISCKLFTFLYSADMDHILREALRYIDTLNRLQNRNDDIHPDFRQFWNNNMTDHAKSMRGLFDPTETAYFNTANQFVYLYENLIRSDGPHPEDLTNAKQIRDFKSGTTQGLIECKVKSIMSPLYTDHLLREANHYIYLLKS